MNKTKGVLFDLDGVLVLTEPLKAEAHGETVRRLGGSLSLFSSQLLYQEVMGQAHEVVMSAFLSAGGLRVDPEMYTRLYLEVYREALRTQLETTPGIEALLGELVSRGYRLAVASSTHVAVMKQILHQVDLAQFFSVSISADDVANRKPAPDAYLLALDRLGVSATSAVIIEDSETGVQAAVSAGMPVLAVRHSFNHRHNFSRAHAVLDSLLDARAIIQTIEALLKTSPNI